MVAFLRSTAFAVWLLAGTCALADVASQRLDCERYTTWLAARRIEPRDAAVELELGMSPEVMGLLTTVTGDLSPLLEGTEPEFLRHRFPGRPLDKVGWDELNYEDKRALLVWVTQKRNVDFLKERTLTGLKTRPEVTVTFAEPTFFLGHEYPAGTHRVNVESILLDVVEYRSINDVENVSGGELKFRAGKPRQGKAPALSAGTVSRDATTLLTGLGIPPPHQHVYIVAPLPIDALKADPEIQSAMMGDFYRRVNLIAEMASIMDGRKIRKVRVVEGVMSGYLTRGKLKGVMDYLRAIAAGKDAKTYDDFKIAAAGFWGSDKFDEPGLWGIEYRKVHRGSERGAILDAIQRAMLSGDYGTTREHFENWLKATGTKPSRAEKQVTESWYGRWAPLSILNAPKGTRLGLLGVGWAHFMILCGEHQELKMLVHDWSRDPILFDKPELQQQIRAAQTKALEKLARHGDHPINPIMREFLMESGLYQSFLGSLGLQLGGP